MNTRPPTAGVSDDLVDVLYDVAETFDVLVGSRHVDVDGLRLLVD